MYRKRVKPELIADKLEENHRKIFTNCVFQRNEDKQRRRRKKKLFFFHTNLQKTKSKIWI